MARLLWKPEKQNKKIVFKGPGITRGPAFIEVLMFSKVQISNMALVHLGSTRLINDLDEDSMEAKKCKAFIDVAIAMIFKQSRPEWARTIKTLALVETDETDLLPYSYLKPVDCADLISLSYGGNLYMAPTGVKWNFLESDQGTLIVSNLKDARAEYIKIISNTAMYPVDFVTALSYLLGYFIGPGLMSGDRIGVADSLFKKYRMFLSQAAASSRNETNDPVNENYTTPSIAARG